MKQDKLWKMLHFKRSILLATALFIAIIASCSSFGQGLDQIGVRLIVPLGKMPFMVGIDIGTHLTFGWVIGSLLLAPDGKTLILASTDVEIAGSQNAGVTFFRGTIGLYYFDLSALLPSFILGGGLSYRFSFDEHISIAASSEIMYPLALGPPMFTFNAGWSP